jgi:hypothetical protein
MSKHGGMIMAEETFKFVHQCALWQSYQQSHLVANQEDLGKGYNDFIYEISLSYS